MRLIAVSNRLPLALNPRDDGTWEARPSTGGLVTALRPILRRHGGTWVGWSGPAGADPLEQSHALAEAAREMGCALRAVDIPAADHDGFYRGFANECVWPLFHDLPSFCRFEPGYYAAAERVQACFAAAVDECRPRTSDLVWVHDYHLIGLARALRARGITAKLAFFLHIPFPSVDLFCKLPWRFQLLRDLLEFDLVGVQTPRDRHNVLDCIRFLIDDAHIRARGNLVNVVTRQRQSRVGAFPIGIDFNEFADHAASPDVAAGAAGIRADEPNRSILLGVDRLDYTKGLPHRLDAFARALDTFPDLRGMVTLFQYVVPSREDIPRYAEFKRELERRVGEINGRFTRSGWVPVHYIFRGLERARLLAWYRASHVALVTPLKDGMNLVAKEYCAANRDGVLVLSEFAGAATQLQTGALIVNPHDVEGSAAAIERAVHIGPEERRLRMRKMRRTLRERDVYWWLDTFLRAAVSRNLDDFPAVDDYVPTPEAPV